PRTDVQRVVALALHGRHDARRRLDVRRAELEFALGLSGTTRVCAALSAPRRRWGFVRWSIADGLAQRRRQRLLPFLHHVRRQRRDSPDDQGLDAAGGRPGDDRANALGCGDRLSPSAWLPASSSWSCP